MRCIFCNRKFSKTTVGKDLVQPSVEHIIPNNIGGRLKSSDLICTGCNSRLGSRIDSALDKKFDFILNLFSIKKDRGQNTDAICYQNERLCIIKPDGTTDFASAEVELDIKDGKVVFHIYSPMSKKIVQRDIPKAIAAQKELLLSHNIDYKKSIATVLCDTLARLKNKDYALVASSNTKLDIKRSYDSKAIFLAILKIAFMFAGKHKLLDAFDSDAIREQLNSGCANCVYYYIGREHIFQYGEMGLFHSLGIAGSKQAHTLICYVELFTLGEFVCILNDNYQGEDVSFTYSYDLLNKKNVSPVFSPNYSLKSLKENICNNLAEKQARERLRQLLQNISSFYNCYIFPRRILEYARIDKSCPIELVNFLNSNFEKIQDKWKNNAGMIFFIPQHMRFPLFAQLLQSITDEQES